MRNADEVERAAIAIEAVADGFDSDAFLKAFALWKDGTFGTITTCAMGHEYNQDFWGYGECPHCAEMVEQTA